MKEILTEVIKSKVDLTMTVVTGAASWFGLFPNLTLAAIFFYWIVRIVQIIYETRSKRAQALLAERENERDEQEHPNT